jgi:hypothetical protein
MKSGKKPDWCSVVRVQPRNLFAMPDGVGTDADGEMDLESVVGVEDINLEQQNEDVTTWSRSSLEGVSVDASVIEEALATAMPEPDHDDLIAEDEDPDDTYIADGVIPPFSNLGEDSDDDFFRRRYYDFLNKKQRQTCINLILLQTCTSFALVNHILALAIHSIHPLIVCFP